MRMLNIGSIRQQTKRREQFFLTKFLVVEMTQKCHINS